METEIRVIENPELIKVLANETRVKIMEEISKEPRSISQLARIFGITPVAIYYHIKKLEKAGFINLAKTSVVNNNFIEKYYQKTIPPFVIGLSTEAPLRAPVPPKKHIAKQIFAINMTEIGRALSSLGLTYPPEKEDQLERNVIKLLEITAQEAEAIHKEILKQLNLKLSLTDRLKIESSIEALITLTLLRIINKHQCLETLRSIIQMIGTK